MKKKPINPEDTIEVKRVLIDQYDPLQNKRYFGYRYDIRNKITNREGNIFIRFIPLDGLETKMSEKCQEFIDENYRTDIGIPQIFNFKPHDSEGKESRPEYSGLGIGTHLIKIIKNDLKKAGHKLIYVRSEEQAVEFYDKQGFIPFGNLERIKTFH